MTRHTKLLPGVGLYTTVSDSNDRQWQFNRRYTLYLVTVSDEMFMQYGLESSLAANQLAINTIYRVTVISHVIRL